mgnify:CR=1 FL=1
MNLSQLLTFSYYFDLSPSASYISIFWGIYFLTLLTIRIYIRMHCVRKPLKSLNRIAVLGIIAVLIRQTELPLLSMRLWTYLLFFLSLIILWQLYNASHEKPQHDEHWETIGKYLPKKKR